MVKTFNTFQPQLNEENAVALSNEAKLSLYKKSQKSNIPVNVLEEVYRRGYSIWNESFGDSPEQFAFDRVNSFVSGGFARKLDTDLCETQYWAIATPRGGSAYSKQKGHWRRVPNTKFDTEESAKKYGDKYHTSKVFGKVYKVISHPDSKVDESYTYSEPTSNDESKPSNRFVGSDELMANYISNTPGQTKADIIKRIVKEKRKI